MQPQIGVSYCYVRSPVNHIYLLLGELNTVAELSIVTNVPENMQRRGAMYLQRELKDKVAMMNRLQQALEHNHFFLMAQPITGMRGDVYHEILLRMKGENDEPISPDSFLPVAHEFGLSSSIDMWVVSIRCNLWLKTERRCPLTVLLLICLQPRYVRLVFLLKSVSCWLNIRLKRGNLFLKSPKVML